jgi:hypothetical protein
MDSINSTWLAAGRQAYDWADWARTHGARIGCWRPAKTFAKNFVN